MNKKKEKPLCVYVEEIALKAKTLSESCLAGEIEVSDFKSRLLTLALTSVNVSIDEMEVLSKLVEIIYEVKKIARSEILNVLEDVKEEENEKHKYHKINDEFIKSLKKDSDEMPFQVNKGEINNLKNEPIAKPQTPEERYKQLFMERIIDSGICDPGSGVLATHLSDFLKVEINLVN